MDTHSCIPALSALKRFCTIVHNLKVNAKSKQKLMVPKLCELTLINSFTDKLDNLVSYLICNVVNGH